MGILNKLFGSPKADPQTSDKTAALERIAVMFDAMKADYLKVVIDGLSDPDIQERKSTALLIADRVVPALDDDKNLESRRLSMRTLALLVKELRPPSSPEELSNLDNAMFYFAKRELRETPR